MKAIANPVDVDFAVITEVFGIRTPKVAVTLDWGGTIEDIFLTPGQVARYDGHPRKHGSRCGA